MSNLKNILNSFKTQDELNPKIWDTIDDGYTLKPKIREQLLKIANEFFESLKVDIVISDITFTGSLANFNWSNFSDIDLHLIADFTQFNEEDLPIYEELFLLKKTVFNEKHDIKILGYEVELYVQDENEEHTSTGVYSVLNNEWISEPKKESKEVDLEFVKKKSEKWMKEIDSIIQLAEEEPLDEAKNILKKFREKIKKYRQCGLEKGGEFSIENLVFKVLRRNGYIEKLFNENNKIVDKKLSIKEQEVKDPELKEPEKAKQVKPDVQDFYNTLEKIDKNIYQEEAGNYTFQKDVESVQIALDILGYPLPRFGVDGKFGPETAKAVNDFKKDNNLKLIVTESLIRESLLASPLPTLKPGSPFKQVRKTKKFPGWRYHWGVDLGIKSGTPIKSPAEGTVIDAGFKDNNCGGTLKIKHPNGIETRYCHCKEFFVKKDDIVKQGDIVALTGGAKGDVGRGNSSGDHLHFEVKKDGVLVNPMDYIGDASTYGTVSELPDSKVFKDSAPEPKEGKSFISPEMSKKLVEKLKEKKLTSEELEKYTKQKIDFSNVVVEGDKDFYNAILEGIGAPKTESNMKFLLAWRQAEGGTAKNNPFNTTYSLDSDANMCIYNCLKKGEKAKKPLDCKTCPTGFKPGVKHYSTPQYGIEATVKTLKLNHYTCIVDGLKQEKDPTEISKCSSLSTWGTGEGISNVLAGGKINPKPIV